MSDMSSAEAPKYEHKVEQPLATGDCLKAADATTINRLKNLVPDKARHALRLSAQKAALTASGLYLLISSGCGNIENPVVPTSAPEPTRASAPLPENTSHNTELIQPSAPTKVPTPTPTIPPVQESTLSSAEIQETPAYLESKIIDGMETYGVESPLTQEQLPKLYDKLNSQETEMKNDTYYGTIFISESTYRNFSENFKASVEILPGNSNYSNIIDLLEESTREKGEYFIKQGKKDENHDGRTVLFLKGITEPGTVGITSEEGNQILMFIDKDGPKGLRLPGNDAAKFIEAFKTGRYLMQYSKFSHVASNNDWPIYPLNPYTFDLSEKGFTNIFQKNINVPNNADNLSWSEAAVNRYMESSAKKPNSQILYKSVEALVGQAHSLAAETTGNYSFQKFLRTNEEAFNKMVREQPYPNKNKLSIRRFIVVQDGVQTPHYQLSESLKDSDGGWHIAGKYLNNLEEASYYDKATGVDYGLLHELGHAVFHLNDQYVLDFDSKEQLPSLVESRIPAKWRSYFASRRKDIGSDLMNSQGHSLGLYTNLQLMRRITQDTVHNFSYTKWDHHAFPYEIPKLTTFSFGKDYANATVDILRSNSDDPYKKDTLETIGAYVTPDTGNLSLTKDLLFVSDPESGHVNNGYSILLLQITKTDGKHYYRWMDIRDFNIPYWQALKFHNKEHVIMNFKLASEKDDPKSFDWTIRYGYQSPASP